MSAEIGFTRSWQAGRFKVTMTCPKPRPGVAACAAMEWEPMPQRLTPAEARQYREGRDRVIAALAEETGIRMIVID